MRIPEAGRRGARPGEKEKGTKIGEILGLVSGWGFFIFWIVIWVRREEKEEGCDGSKPEVLVDMRAASRLPHNNLDKRYGARAGFDPSIAVPVY